MKRRNVLTILALLAPALATVPAAVRAQAPATDEAKIRHLMRGIFDRPEAPLAVEPVVVEGDHALAGWIQGEQGGRALLRRHGGAWMIAFCSGDALKSAKTLAEIGVPKPAADALASRLAAAEAKLDPKRVAMFSRFDGLVKMDAHGNHPPGHGHPPKPNGHTH
ncbi:MAG: copper uptake system-associated protein [Rhodospirillaceae bacterium]|nr:copper uptake system-associated protein [Rhodospirillaceae bacterium]